MKKQLQITVGLIPLAALVACASEPPAKTSADAETPQVVVEIPMTTGSEEAKAHFREGLRAADLANEAPETRSHFVAAMEADPDFALAHLGVAFTSNTTEEFASHLKAAGEKAQAATEAEAAWIASVQKGFENDLEGQLEQARKLTEAAPDSPRAWLQLANAQAALADYEQARAAATKALEVSPGFYAAHTALGNSYLFNEPRDYSRAEEHFKKAAELEPDEQNSHDLLGDVYRAQGKLEEARIAYTRASELDPDNGSPLQQRGHVNSFLGNYEEARADYQKAMDLSDPDTAAAFGVYKALVSVHAGDPQAAIGEFEELMASIDTMGAEGARDLKVGALSAVVTIASHYEMTEAAEKAIAQCRTLMMERAEEVGTEEYRRSQEARVAFFEGRLAAQTGAYESAMAKAQEYMRIREAEANPRKNEPAHVIMGLASYKAGKYDEAIEHFEQVDPAGIYARYHLGLAHEGAGNTEEAAAIFRDVAGHNFNFPAYALIRKDAMEKASG